MPFQPSAVGADASVRQVHLLTPGSLLGKPVTVFPLLPALQGDLSCSPGLWRNTCLLLGQRRDWRWGRKGS